MRPGFDADTSAFDAALKKIEPSADELKDIGFAGSAVVKMNQKIDVAKDTHATENSISDHIVTSTRTTFVDDVGPETEYAPNIEFGRRDMPNYPIQPFVRPSAHGNKKRDALNAITTAFHEWILSKWPR